VGLLVTSVELRDFRNYENLRITPDPELTLLVGPNATGKTNVIEAIQLLTAAVSFRRPLWAETVRWGASEARLEMTAHGDGRSLDVEMRVTSEGRRTYHVNGKPKRTISEVAGILPCVVFTPDDLRMVKDAAEKRRAAVDGVGDQLSAAYRSARAEYERILRQRNRLLKDDCRDDALLRLWTDRLVESGASYTARRRRLFERLAEKMSEVYLMLAGREELVARYRPSWEAVVSEGESGRAAMEGALRVKRMEEMRRRVSLVGPHRDEISFSIDGKDARSFASQGQQRTIALAWKLAEVKVMTEVAGQPPVLLLDDVMSELDEARRHALARFVGEAAQTLVTTTNLGYFDPELVERAETVKLS
jgi:DNA replication and repair protein RecF